MSRVPEEWARLTANLRVAQAARCTMRDPEASQRARDHAVVQYTRASDDIIADLGRLAEARVLTRIGLFLQRPEVK